MEINLFEILKKAKEISPDKGFSEKSKRFIFASQQNEHVGFLAIQRFFSPLRIIMASGLVFAVMAIVALQNPALRGDLAVRTGLKTNGQDVKTESENLDIDIKLKEIQYFDDSKDEVATLLKEIRDFQFNNEKN